jgi:hypothetical protein
MLPNLLVFVALGVFIGPWVVVGLAATSLVMAGAYAIASVGSSKPGTDPIDLFWGAALLYVVLGSVVGSILAVHQDKLICWPTAVFYSVLVDCDDTVLEQFWMYAVVLPVELLNGAVRGLLVVTSNYETDAFDIGMTTLRSAVLGIIVACGLPVIYERSRILAWLVLALLIGEVVYLRTLVPDVAAWLWAT